MDDIIISEIAEPIGEGNKKKEELLIDKIMEKTTFSKHRIYIMICMIFMFLTNGMEMCLFNLIIMPFKNYFYLKEGFLLEFTTSLLFLGVAFGSGAASYISKIFGRIPTIKILIIILSIFHLLMGLFLYLPVFIICRFAIGFCLGNIIPILINIYGEYLPDKYRGVLLMLAWSFFGFGMVILNIHALIIMPELEKEKIQKLLLIILSLPILSTISCLIFLNDSPRNLLLSLNEENIEKAYVILKGINSDELNEEEEEKILEELKISRENNSENVTSRYFFKKMFSPYYKKTTILIILIFFLIAYNSYGVFTISSLTLDILNNKEKQKNNQNLDENENISNRNIIINQIMLSIAEVISDFIGGIIGEWKKLGRKGAIILFGLLSVIFIIASPFKKLLYEILIPIGSACTSIYTNLAMDYAVEFYPTKIRDKSTSLLFMVYRISCFLSQFLSIGVFNFTYFFPYIIDAIFCILLSVFTFLLPYEVAGKSLD